MATNNNVDVAKSNTEVHKLCILMTVFKRNL